MSEFIGAFPSIIFQSTLLSENERIKQFKQHFDPEIESKLGAIYK